MHKANIPFHQLQHLNIECADHETTNAAPTLTTNGTPFRPIEINLPKFKITQYLSRPLDWPEKIDWTHPTSDRVHQILYSDIIPGNWLTITAASGIWKLTVVVRLVAGCFFRILFLRLLLFTWLFQPRDCIVLEMMWERVRARCIQGTSCRYNRLKFMEERERGAPPPHTSRAEKKLRKRRHRQRHKIVLYFLSGNRQHIKRVNRCSNTTRAHFSCGALIDSTNLYHFLLLVWTTICAQSVHKHLIQFNAWSDP